MHQTPLHKFHLDHGAQMVEFAGWEMPIRYRGIQEEHHQVRRSGGLFDVSHMGRFEVKGLHARRLLERVCSRRIIDMEPGQCRYALVCNEAGGVKDDVIVLRQDEDEFLVVVNGANREKLFEHFRSTAESRAFKVKLEDRTLKTAMVALQGPRVMDLIGRVSREVPSLKRFRFTVKNLVIVKLVVSRTGYTGEDGVEVILPAQAVPMAMKLLLKDIDIDAEDAPVRPIGLGARDTLRLEAGMPLYGHELGEEINALECSLDFAISLDKSEETGGETFIGQDALLRTRDAGGPARRLVGLELEGRRTARQGMAVMSGAEKVGEVTSGCLSPTLDRSIAMAFVRSDLAGPGTDVTVDAGRAELAGRVAPLPFYKAPKATPKPVKA